MIIVKITRMGNAKQGMADCLHRIAPRVELGIMAAGQVLLEESRKVVPEDTGILRDSAGCRQISFGLTTRARVFYGPQGVKVTLYSHKEEKMVTREPYYYAAAVHEKPATHDAGKKDHYLSDVCLTKRVEMRAALRAAL